MRRIPFSEMIEAAAKRARSLTDDTSYRNIYGDYINTAYSQLGDEVPYLWDGMREENTITLLADYQTGTVEVTNGSTTVTGTGTTWTAAMDGRKFKVTDDDDVYTFTYVSATSGTLDRAYLGDTDTSANYILWKEAYLLRTNVIQDPAFKAWWNRNGVPVYLKRAMDDTWQPGDKTTQPTIPTKFRLYDVNNSNQMYLEINAPDDDGRYLHYDCLVTLEHLYEYDTGTASVTQDMQTIIGVGTRWLSDGLEDGMWFRFESDGTGDRSLWYLIESVVSNTELKLATTYKGSTKASKAYKICNASKLPLEADKAIISLAAALGVTDAGETTQAKALFEAYSGFKEGILKKIRRKMSTRLKTVYERPGVRR